MSTMGGSRPGSSADAGGIVRYNTGNKKGSKRLKSISDDKAVTTVTKVSGNSSASTSIGTLSKSSVESQPDVPQIEQTGSSIVITVPDENEESIEVQDTAAVVQ